MRLMVFVVLAVGVVVGFIGYSGAAPPASEVIVVNEPLDVAGAVEVTNLPPSAPQWQLAGTTAATFTGDMGIFRFTRECQAEFPESRMCTSREVMNSVTLPASLGAEAWVRPSIVGGHSTVAIDASGVSSRSNGSNPEDLSCAGWSDVNRAGLAFNVNGSFVLRLCNSVRHVACCAPVP